jgi:hypothetical protein
MASIAQAQAAFISQGGVEGSSSYTTSAKGKGIQVQFPKGFTQLGVMEAMLAQYIGDFLTAANDNLEANDSVSSGSLSESLTFEIQPAGGGYVINFKANDYYKYVDKGVRGTGDQSGKGLKYTNKNNSSPYAFKHMNPSRKHVDAIRRWITDNNLTSKVTDISKWGGVGRENKGGNMPLNSAAWLVARQIKMGGLKATNFWQDAFDKTFADFGQKMSEALGVSLSVNLEQLGKQIQGNGVFVPKK